MDSLHELLNRDLGPSSNCHDAFFDISNNYAAPGFWAAYVARAKSKNLTLDNLELPEPLLSYARAIGIEEALGQEDSYKHIRKGSWLKLQLSCSARE